MIFNLTRVRSLCGHLQEGPAGVSMHEKDNEVVFLPDSDQVIWGLATVSGGVTQPHSPYRRSESRSQWTQLRAAMADEEQGCEEKPGLPSLPNEKPPCTQDTCLPRVLCGHKSWWHRHCRALCVFLCLLVTLNSLSSDPNNNNLPPP